MEKITLVLDKKQVELLKLALRMATGCRPPGKRPGLAKRFVKLHQALLREEGC